MTVWGRAPARGCVVYCGRCGAQVAFREDRRPRALADEEAERVTLAVQKHFRVAPLCRSAGTFEGRDTAACRCDEPMRLPRGGGLYCARCEGLIAPQVAVPIAPRPRKRAGGAR